MKIGVSCGDLNGIGLECFVKAINNDGSSGNEYVLYGNEYSIFDYLNKCILSNNEYQIIDKNLIVSNKAVEIVNCGNNSDVNFGRIDSNFGRIAIDAIRQCTLDLIVNKTDCMVTLPISKESCYLAGFSFPGHTEYIADMCGVVNPLMLLYYKSFRVALQTIHIPISKVSSSISTNQIIERLIQVYNSLINDFGTLPSIAVLGLNPHAGENGNIGEEEINSIIPAIKAAKDLGINLDGPFPADGFFAHSEHLKYSAILAMYHDQGLIPLKMSSLGNGVNFTAGLPIVRTSPDHGTAFAIAGKGIANYQSTLEAINGAVEITLNRRRIKNELS